MSSRGHFCCTGSVDERGGPALESRMVHLRVGPTTIGLFHVSSVLNGGAREAYRHDYGVPNTGTLRAAIFSIRRHDINVVGTREE